MVIHHCCSVKSCAPFEKTLWFLSNDLDTVFNSNVVMFYLVCIVVQSLLLNGSDNKSLVW